MEVTETTVTYLEPAQRADLSASVATKLASLHTYTASIPPSDTARTPREANAWEQARQQLPLRVARLRAGIATLERRWSELDRARREYELLVAAKAAMMARLPQFDNLTPRERSDRATERAEVVASVVACDHAIRWGDAEPRLLREWLRAHGEARLPGHSGLGTLPQVQARIADLARECAALESQLETQLAQPLPPLTTEGSHV